MVGFVTFVAMDKGLRIAIGGEGGHDHGHSYVKEAKQEHSNENTSAKATGANPGVANGNVNSRKRKYSDSIFSDDSLLSLSPSVLRRLWQLNEPRRAHRWLEETLEGGPTSSVT